MSMLDLIDNVLSADKSHFSLSVNGVPSGLIQLLDFSSNNDALCDSYRFELNILSNQLIEPAALLGKDAELAMVWAREDQKITGIISHFMARGKSHQGYHYALTLSSPLSLLQHAISNRVFTNMSVQAVIESVFKKSGFPMAKLNISASGPQLEMVVQYNETDFEFVTRLMRKYGFVYGVNNHQGGGALHICSTSDELAQQCNEIDLSFQEPSGQVRLSETILAISREATLLTSDTSYNDYNYESPGNLTLTTQNNSDTIGFGQTQLYGENYQHTSDGQALADVMQQSLDCQRDQLIVDTDCRALRPGVTLNIHNHDDYNGTYLVLRVEHKGSQGAGIEYGGNVKGLTYKNQAWLIPVSLPYKAVVPPSRRIFATFNATIEQEVDDQGRYIVNLPFNQDGEGKPSKPGRLMQPYGGQGHGMHFPLTQGTEVLVTGENGDLDRPIILGALYNSQSPSPVNNNNATENKLVTRAGHTFLMDDKQGEEKIHLGTKDAKNALTLDATTGSHHATLESVEGDVKISAKEQLNFVSESDHNVTAGKNMTTLVEESISVQTRQGDITLKSAKDFSAKADSNIRVESTSGSVDINAKKKINIQAGQDVSLYVQEGNVELQAAKGDVSIEAKNNISIKGIGSGSIQLSQGGASLEIDAGGNLNIDATNITLSAGNIVIKGNALSNN